MRPITLGDLVANYPVEISQDGFATTASPTWIVPEEDRLSYTTIIRLVECCRELHWERDILPNAESQRLDCITKSIKADFLIPISVDSRIFIVYRIMEVRNKGYSIKFLVRNRTDERLHAIVDIVVVFWDPVVQEISSGLPRVTEHLRKLCVLSS